MAINITGFINSPDVAAECIRVGKIFSAQEKMTIVAKSARPMEERIHAYQEIAAEDNECGKILCSIIVWMQNKLKDFPIKKEGYFFLPMNNRDFQQCSYIPPISSDFSVLLQLCRHHTKSDHIEIIKTQSDSVFYEHAFINSSGEIVNIYNQTSKGESEYRTEFRAESLIKTVELNLPIPFKKGDLVCDYHDQEKQMVFLERVNINSFKYIWEENVFFTLFQKKSTDLNILKVSESSGLEDLVYCKSELPEIPLKYAQQAIKNEIDFVTALQNIEPYVQNPKIVWSNEDDE